MKIMNKNEQLIESLHRVKLLMGYKSTMTLTENVENLKDSFINESIIITEGGRAEASKSIITALFGGVDDAVRAASILAKDSKYAAVSRTIDDAIAVTGKIAKTDGLILKNSKDIILALEKGTLSTAGINQLKGGLLKSSSLGTELRATLVHQASVDARNLKYFKGMTQQEIKDVLVKKGINSGIADDIAKELHYKVGGSGKLPVTGGKGKTTTTGGKGKTTTTGGKGKTTTTGKGGKNTKKAKKERIKEPDPIPNKPTRWQSFKTQIAGMTRGKILKYLLITGGLYLVYKWWMDEPSSMFPDCISKNIPEEDFKKMAEQGLDYVLITDTGNSAIDKNGGGKFFDDKKFVTGNDKYTGTWDDTDSGIVITVGGTDYAMSCEGMKETDDSGTDDSGTDGSGTDGSGTDGSGTDDNTVIPTTTTTTTVYTPGRGDYETSDL